MHMRRKRNTHSYTHTYIIHVHAYMYVWFDPDLSARLLEHEHDRAQALIPDCVAK